MNELITIAIISIGINLLMFIPAYKYRTDKLTDISYALTFVIVSLYSLLQEELSLSKIVLFIMVSIWAGRLGTYLLIRIRKTGRDTRFDEMRPVFWKFFGFWLLQGVSVFIIVIPVAIYLQTGTTSFSIFSMIGFIIWIVGLLIESIADYQKYKFKLKVSNNNNWTTVGLWKYSRHPNYLGEILVWIGIFVYVLNDITINQVLLSSFSPVFITILLLFVSGIPLLEKSYSVKWGKDPRYISYKASTGKLLPKNTLPFVIFLLIPQLAGILGSIVTFSSVNTWYVTISKPVWNPPNWVFGPVWTFLYALMGIASFLIWQKRSTIRVSKALTFYGIQLIFNILWSVLFFGYRNIGLAFIEIVFLWILIILTIKYFSTVNKIAAYLLVPYLAWVSIAALLNLNLWILN